MLINLVIRSLHRDLPLATAALTNDFREPVTLLYTFCEHLHGALAEVRAREACYESVRLRVL